VAGILIGKVAIPMVFTKPGTYPVDNKQKTAFSQGTLYFRHGAKSEPGTTDDLRGALDRQLEDIRKAWISGVRRVVKAPRGSQVVVLPPEGRHSTRADATPIRVVDDPTAPAYRVVDPDVTPPHRQTELIRELQSRLPSSVRFNSFEALVVRRVYGLDGEPELCHRPRFGSPQYSRAMVDWIIGHYESNPRFFEETRELYSQRR